MNDFSFFSLRKNANIIDFLKEVIKRWYFFAVSMLLFFIIAFVYSSFFSTPLYNSTAKLYIISRQTTNLSTADFSISTYLTRDFSQIITDSLVLEEVSDAVDNKYSANQLKGFISINNPDNTRIIELIVRSPDPKDSKLIADSICDISQEKVASILGKDTVKVLRYGEVAKSPSSPNIKRNLQLGMLLGFILSAIIVFIIYITDNTITSAKDIEDYFGLTILATIPYNQTKQKSKN